MQVLCLPHRRLCKLITDVMPCMCSWSMLGGHEHAVAAVRMHAHAWGLRETALCAHCPTPLSRPFLVPEHNSIKSIACNPLLGFLVLLGMGFTAAY